MAHLSYYNDTIIKLAFVFNRKFCYIEISSRLFLKIKMLLSVEICGRNVTVLSFSVMTGMALNR